MQTIFLYLGGKRFQFFEGILLELTALPSGNMLLLPLLHSLALRIIYHLHWLYSPEGEVFTFFHRPAFTTRADTSHRCLLWSILILSRSRSTLCVLWWPWNHGSQLSHEVYNDCISFPALFYFVFPRVVLFFGLRSFLCIYHWFHPKLCLRLYESPLKYSQTH